jgi:hypothetical protein
MPKGIYNRNRNGKPKLVPINGATPGERTSMADELLRMSVASLQERALEGERRLEWHRQNSEAYHQQHQALIDQGHEKFIPLFDSLIGVYVRPEIEPKRFDSVLNSALRELGKTIASIK